MLVTINTNNKNVDWASKGVNRIAQNVFNLISTYKYEVAFDRTLGIDRSFIDKPLPIAISEATVQIYNIVAEREPRATVESVDFLFLDDKGNLNFKVVIEV